MAEEPKVYSKNGLAILFDILGTIFGILVLCVWVLGAFGLLLAIIAIPIGVIYIYLRDKSYRYELREDGVYVYHGVISRTHSLFLYEKIQDVNEVQSFVQRIFNLKNLRISTMTSESQTGGMLYGLTEAEATQVRKEVLENVYASTHKVEKSTIASKSAPAAKRIFAEMGKLQGEFAPSMESVYFYLKLVLASFIASVMLAFIIGLGAVLVFIIGLLAFGLPAMVSLIYQKFTFLQYDNEKIFIKTGFLSKLTTTIPYDRIQDIRISRGVIDRQIGLASIKILTGERLVVSNDKNLPPQGLRNLSVNDALSIYQYVMERIHCEEEEEKPLAQMADYPFVGSAFLAASIKPFVVVLVIAAIGMLFSPFWLILLLLLPLILLYYHSFFKSVNYYFTDKNLVMQRGILINDTISTPLKNVQDVIIGQGLVDRLLGLYYVKVSTITESAGLMTYGCLSEQTARSLSDFLQSLIKKTRSRN